jgi:DUF1365 family protein
MSLYYPTVDTFPVLGTKSGTTRTSVALASTYTQSKAFEVSGFSKLDLAVLYTMGAAETSNSIEIQIEHSPDGTNWYRIPNESVSGGTSTLTAREFTFVGTNAAAATISIGIDIFYKYIKVSAKESGVATNAGTVYIEATLNGK